MNRYRIVHKTSYWYNKPVTLSHSEGHLLPLDNEHQHCESAGLRIEPVPGVHYERRDYFGNRVNYFALEVPHRHIEVVSESFVSREISPRIPQTPEQVQAAIEFSPSWESVRDMIAATPDPNTEENTNSNFGANAEIGTSSVMADFDLQEYTFASPMIPAVSIDLPGVASFVQSIFTPGRSLFGACLDLNARIFTDFKYDSGFSRIGTPLKDVISARRGVCQDFAHLFLACMRRAGLPARYASGYLETKPPEGRPRLQGADASHAWASVYFPGPNAGWIDFDPTNNLIVANQHVVLGYGRDYSDVTPLKGVIFGGGKHTVKVEVDVLPIDKHNRTIQ